MFVKDLKVLGASKVCDIKCQLIILLRNLQKSSNLSCDPVTSIKYIRTNLVLPNPTFYELFKL